VITVNDDKEREKRSILAIVILALVRLVLYISNGSVCGITFYQPKEPDLSELFEINVFPHAGGDVTKISFFISINASM
jgi:cyclic lactone autoinducer peptide